jgi:hypothetical protein
MNDRVYTLDELARPRWRQIFDRTVDGRASRFMLSVLSLVTALYAVRTAAGAYRAHAQRESVLARHKAEASKLPASQIALLDRADQSIMAMASEPSPAGAGPTPDWISPRLRAPGAARALLSGNGVYFRAVQTEVPVVEAVHVAAGLSVKDAVVMCMLRDEDSSTDELQRKIQEGCEPGTGCLGESNGRVHNLRLLTAGLGVLSDRWAAQAADSGNAAELGLMDAELREKSRVEIPRAREIASKAAYLMVVLDEVPAQLPKRMWGSRRDLVQAADHEARIGIFDAQTGEPLARLRREMSSNAPLSSGASVEVRRQMTSCQLGLDVREALDEAASRSL